MTEPIAVLIPTYRVDLVPDTVEALSDLLVYDGPINFYIGVDYEYMEAAELAPMIQRKAMSRRIVVLDGPRRTTDRILPGYLGANINMLYRTAQDDGHVLYMQMDDDHILTRCLDINGHANKLLSDETAGWIRLMGIGWHYYCGCLIGAYWHVNWSSPEAYIPSNRPHIKHKRFHDTFGMYPEGLKLGATEEGFCHQCKDIATINDKVPHVLVPLDVMTESAWMHVGHSLQELGK